MMRLLYLFDSDMSIYCIKQKPPAVVQHLAKLPPGVTGISVITYGELWRGVQKSQQRERNCRLLTGADALKPAGTPALSGSNCPALSG